MSATDSTLLKVANLAAFLLTATINLFASFEGINGISTGQVSDLYPTAITPAGFTFTIWTAIYGLLLAFSIFQFLPRNKGKDFVGRIGFLFVLSCLINVTWLFLWHYFMITTSVVLMLALLVCLALIYMRLEIGKSRVSAGERLAVHLPFSVYLGWITVATIANISSALVAIGWDGFGIAPATWGVLVIAVAVLITVLVIAMRKDAGFSIVLIWALFGIMSKQTDSGIVLACQVSIAIIAVALSLSLVISRKIAAG